MLLKDIRIKYHWFKQGRKQIPSANRHCPHTSGTPVEEPLQLPPLCPRASVTGAPGDGPEGSADCQSDK